MTPIQSDIIGAIPRLRRLARSLCRDRAGADDLVQDTVERALRKFQQFGGGNLSAWLATIMLNQFRSQRRTLARRPVLVDIDDPLIAGKMAGAPFGEGMSDIADALDRLPEEQRTTLLLRTLEGLSYAEIAEAQNIPIGTVMSRLSRARETIRQLTEADNVISIGRPR